MAGNPTKWLTGWDFAHSFLTSRHCRCKLDKLTKQAVSTHPTRQLSACVGLGVGVGRGSKREEINKYI